MTSGTKYDDGKPNVGMTLQYFPHALLEISKVSDMGAVKYSPFNWLRVPNAEKRYFNALCRHLIDYCQGYESDEESNLSTLAHLAWNALAILELECREKNDSV